MAINEQSVLLRRKDVEGNSVLFYPITNVDNVDGLDVALAEKQNKDFAVTATIGAMVDSIEGLNSYAIYAMSPSEMVYYEVSLDKTFVEISDAIQNGREVYIQCAGFRANMFCDDFSTISFLGDAVLPVNGSPVIFRVLVELSAELTVIQVMSHDMFNRRYIDCGYIISVNGVAPGDDGNVAITPSSLGAMTDVPVTADDAGKFLRVSSGGVWVAESLQNAEGVSF